MKKLIFLAFFFTLITVSPNISKHPYGKGKNGVTAPEHNIDHLIVAINDLEKGIEMFEELTGIKPVIGGEHPGRGTHNALISLGGNTYMEIIAPRPNLDSSEYKMSEHLLVYEELTPVGWAITSADAANTKETIAEMDFTVSDLRAGSRKKPDGNVLSWITFAITDQLAAFPFFIQWGKDSAHPSSTSPSGVELKSVKIVTPDSEKLSVLVNTLELDVEVAGGETAFMEITLNTDKGEVVISGK